MTYNVFGGVLNSTQPPCKIFLAILLFLGLFASGLFPRTFLLDRAIAQSIEHLPLYIPLPVCISAS